MMPSLSGLLYYLKTVFDGTNDLRKSDIWLYLGGMSEEKYQVLNIPSISWGLTFVISGIVLSKKAFDGSNDTRKSDIWFNWGVTEGKYQVLNMPSLFLLF